MDARSRPERRHLPHAVPSWVRQGARHFVTINHRLRGSDRLTSGGTPQTLLESATFYEEVGRWYIWIMLVMPDHLHAILTFNFGHGLKSTTSAWKGYQAKFLGIDWQEDFFDHRLRNEGEFLEKAHCIRMNPVRAGLVGSPGEWPHVIDRTGPS